MGIKEVRTKDIKNELMSKFALSHAFFDITPRPNDGTAEIKFVVNTTVEPATYLQPSCAFVQAAKSKRVQSRWPVSTYARRFFNYRMLGTSADH